MTKSVTLTVDLATFADRLEASSGPERELDVLIAERVGWQDGLVARARTWSPNNTTAALVADVDGDGYLRGLPRYTSSFDAAMTLVPQGWIVEIRRHFNGEGEYVAAVWLTDSFTVGRGCDPDEKVTVSARIVETTQGVDPTPLAITVAALRAQAPAAANHEERLDG